MISESVKLTLYNIKHRRLRFALTILAIAVGIAAIVSLVSVGQSMEDSINRQFEQFGTDKIIVMAGDFSQGMAQSMMSSVSLTDEDVEMIESVNNVEFAVGSVVGMYPVNYKDEQKLTYIYGLPSDKTQEFFEEVQARDLKEGRFFEEGENYAAVIGYVAYKEIFEKEIRLKSEVTIEGVPIKVVGIFEKTGDPMDDRAFMVSLETLQEIEGKENNEYMVLFIKVTDDSKVGKTAEDIEEELEDKYGENVFSATTTEQLAAQISQIFSIISLVLVAISAIALIVAGIGTANTMYMNIMERTKEIGVIKAIGATNIQVLEIFLVESAIIGLIGGMVGCALGLTVGYMINYVASLYFPTLFVMSIRPETLIFAVIFSMVIGIVAGLLPARKAASMNPVDALRYE